MALNKSLTGKHELDTKDTTRSKQELAQEIDNIQRQAKQKANLVWQVATALDMPVNVRLARRVGKATLHKPGVHSADSSHTSVHSPNRKWPCWASEGRCLVEFIYGSSQRCAHCMTDLQLEHKTVTTDQLDATSQMVWSGNPQAL